MGKISSPFHSADFRKWYLAETLLSLGVSTQFAMSLLLIDIAHSLAFAGIVASVLEGVTLLGGLVGGAFADHRARRSMIQRCVVVNIGTVVVLILMLASHEFGIAMPSGLLLIAVTLVAMLMTISGALADPALDAALKELIIPEQYPRAASAAEVRNSLIALGSRSVTGALYSLAAVCPFIVRLACDCGFLAAIRGIRRSFDPPLSERQHAPMGLVRMLKTYREGMKHVFGSPVIRTITLCAPLVNLMVFTGSSWMLFSMRSAGASAFLIGVVTSGFAIGSMTGAFIAPRLTDKTPSGILAMSGLVWMTCMFFLTVMFVERPVLLCVMAAVCMFPSPAIGGAMFAHVFANTPSELQGRTMGLFTLFNGLATIPAPSLAALGVAHHAAPQVAAGVAFLSIVGIAALALTPATRRLPSLQNLHREDATDGSSAQ